MADVLFFAYNNQQEKRSEAIYPECCCTNSCCKVCNSNSMTFYIRNEDITRGSIEEVTCSKCSFKNTKFTIIGDSWAMNFLGLIGLTSENKRETIITYLTKEEFENFGMITGRDVADRVNQLLNRKDLIFFKKKRDVNGKLTIPCPKCETPLQISNQQSLEQYIESGGKIICINCYE